MHNKRIITALTAAVLLAVSVSASVLAPDHDAEGTGTRVLFDFGNGKTEWFDAVTESGDTADAVLRRTAEANGMTYSSAGGIVLNGISGETIGGPASGGSLTESGTTGIIINADWRVFRWDGGEWADMPPDDPCGSFDIALGFYPSGCVPAETPDHPSSWTMIRGDAEQSGSQEDVIISPGETDIAWDASRGGTSGVYAAIVCVEDVIFVKFGADRDNDPAVRCYTHGGGLVWEFEYPGVMYYETATPLIAGDHIYVPAADGYIFKMPWRTGPGAGNADVTTFGNIPMASVDTENNENAIPDDTGADLTGFSYEVGPGSLVYDSGAIYCSSSNGMVYCFDLNLNLIWSSQMMGHTYYLSPTVCGGYLFSGALNGTLYVLDKRTGGIIDEETVYTKNAGGEDYGSVSSVSVIRHGQEYTLMFSVSDGRGMSSTVGGIGIYGFDGSALTKISLTLDTFGLVGSYLLPVAAPEFEGVFFTATKGVFMMHSNGTYRLLNDQIYSVKSPPLLVNNSSVYLLSYAPSRPVYEMGLDGKVISEWVPKSSTDNYRMSPLVFAGGMMFYGCDAGVVAVAGTLPEYVPAADGGTSPVTAVLMLLAAAAVLLMIPYIYLRFAKGIERPFRHLRKKVSDYLGSEELKHNMRSRHRLFAVLTAGLSATAIMFIICLCIGPTSVMSAGDMLSSLFSSISKGGNGLSYDELMIYESRLPRTVVALSAGIGLSIAGCMYQAIIRNPLVDPYIMGVSAGAGTAAVAVIAFDFTFFGLFSPHSIYLTAFAAMAGGTAAFFATMFIAEKAGGNSLNYVLGGVVVGLAFSSIQTLMLSMAGHEVSNALAWLFGSFSNISWNHVWAVFFPALALSLAPLIWAKEFNLVLLGEDQAQQMGLNVRRFSRTMLIMASVLTSVCVAFVGIIGFVGLVIPHLCRMMLGGDHRLVMPASIAFGGALMMLADLSARTLLMGQELPVGAITTMIGVPVFAYLLIRRGKMYEG